MLSCVRYERGKQVRAILRFGLPPCIAIDGEAFLVAKIWQILLAVCHVTGVPRSTDNKTGMLPCYLSCIGTEGAVSQQLRWKAACECKDQTYKHFSRSSNVDMLLFLTQKIGLKKKGQVFSHLVTIGWNGLTCQSRERVEREGRQGIFILMECCIRSIPE